MRIMVDFSNIKSLILTTVSRLTHLRLFNTNEQCNKETMKYTDEECKRFARIIKNVFDCGVYREDLSFEETSGHTRFMGKAITILHVGFGLGEDDLYFAVDCINGVLCKGSIHTHHTFLTGLISHNLRIPHKEAHNYAVNFWRAIANGKVTVNDVEGSVEFWKQFKPKRLSWLSDV